MREESFDARSRERGGDKLRPFRDLMSLENALNLVLKEVQSINRTVVVPTQAALGRVIVTDIKAPFSVPGFVRATMDGYAVIAEDTFGAEQANPKVLKCTSAVYAGDVPSIKVEKGTCIKIATGAMLPAGADAVVMVEDTEVKETPDLVKIYKPAYPAQHVGKEDEDIGTGDLVLSAGEVLSAAKVGVGAALGMVDMEVFAKPKVAIIPTGNEVAPVGTELKKGQVYDINSFTLGSITMENGGEPVKLGIAGDTEDELEAIIGKAVSETDLVILSGGSSVGERDLLVDVFSRMGKVLFHGIQVKPGKPTLCAVISHKLVFGMPGYPTSCLSNGYIFIRPVLRKLARLQPLPGASVSAKLSQRVVSSLGRHHFLTVRLKGVPPDLTAEPVHKKSGAITSMAHADGYIEIGENVDLLETDEEVEVRLL